MSKIAENKALEAYPIVYYRNGGGIDDANASDRAVYEEGYDQAMKDFIEKACYYLKSTLQEDDETNNFIVQQFKNYMEEQQ